MDGAHAITGRPTASSAGEQTCPRCSEAWGSLASVSTLLFSGIPLRRCGRCGTRFTAGDPPYRLARTCAGCGIPFLVPDLADTDDSRCRDCSSAAATEDVPGTGLVAATEAEVRSALTDCWRFVSSASLSLYLNRVARDVARRVEGAPEASRVVLFEDPRWRILALPSGTILMSLGTLAGLEDEAELVFVLGHELAHAACGSASELLVRLGLRSVAAGNEGAGKEAWVRGAEELLKLGYGRAREREADERAVEALFALGYDPLSVLHYLDRLQVRMERGDAEVQELALSHPPPRDRRRRVEAILEEYLWVDRATPPRVNRELFRRAAGHTEISSGLEPTEGLDQPLPPIVPRGDARRPEKRLLWTALGIVLLAGLFLVVGILLSR